MPGKLQISQKPKSNIFAGDFVILFGIILGFLLTGGFFVKTSNYPDQGAYETEVVPDDNDSKAGLQLETFTVKKCSDLTAIDFLIDNSGSMQFGTKMPELKKALNSFADKFPPTGAIAFQTYSETVKDRVQFQLFRDAKADFLLEVQSMSPLSATHSRDAFRVAQNALEEGKTKFPTHKFSLVFISDGIPETQKTNDACPDRAFTGTCMEHPLVPGECRCYDAEQDPRAIASDLKSAGVRIFTIAFTDDLADKALNDKLQSLMQEVASAPTDYYLAPIESELTDIIKQISNKICSDL